MPPWHGVNSHKPPDGLRQSCGACARPVAARLRRFVVCGGCSAHRPAAPSSPPPVPSGSRSLTRHPPAERNGSQESRSGCGALLPMAKTLRCCETSEATWNTAGICEASAESATSGTRQRNRTGVCVDDSATRIGGGNGSGDIFLMRHPRTSGAAAMIRGPRTYLFTGSSGQARR